MSGDGQWFYIRKWASNRRIQEQQEQQSIEDKPVEEPKKDA